jgi:hypothetical protein
MQDAPHEARLYIFDRAGRFLCNQMAAGARNNEDMNTHWTPGEYDRHTEQLKKALESLRKQDEQLKRTTEVSPKRKAQKKTERVKRSDKRG